MEYNYYKWKINGKGLVSMKLLEFHKEVHTKLIQKKNPALLWGSPFDNGWIGLVLYNHKSRDEAVLRELLDYFSRLIDSTPIQDILREERNIGAFSLYIGIASNLIDKKSTNEIQIYIKRRIIELDKKQEWKFSLFNTPEIFYSVVIGLVESKGLDDNIKNILFKYAVKELKNKWFNRTFRFALYSAALIELGVEDTNEIIRFLISLNVKELSIEEVIHLLWFIVKYEDKLIRYTKNTETQKLIENKKSELLEQFENQYAHLSYEIQATEEFDPREGALYTLSTFMLGLLDDLLASLEKTYKVNPADVFDRLQLHPIIKEASEKLFKNEHYAEAIFEAYKALINYVKERSGMKELDGQDLMNKVFKKEQPIIQLNELSTREEINEQEGYRYLFIGAVQAIRNPLAHAKKEQKDPFEALEYLSFASLLAKKIDKAKINTPTN